MRFLQIEMPDDGFYPAHFPTVVDLVKLNPAAKYLMLWEMEHMPDSEEAPIFPPAWEKFIDPEPTVREYGRVFLLRDYPTLIKNAEFTDAIDIFHVLSPMTHIHLLCYRRIHYDEKRGTVWFNNTNVRPILRKECDPHCMIALHTKVVVWNTRGINRRLFPSRFYRVIRTHQPEILVLQETRCFDDQFEVVRNRLGGMNTIGLVCQQQDPWGGS